MKKSKIRFIISFFISIVLFVEYLIYNIGYGVGVVMANGTLINSEMFNTGNVLTFIILVLNLIINIINISNRKRREKRQLH